ncbi:rho-related GTP-binding protein RhoN-like [Acanthaster planci]|uniref:Rho-related GTP-binding protein RhoN-like n=1 Tax=Acanthaster planci TaxID=133434 RepID=A0A8B7XJE7_ACAPL|nr:rho-related GTP-binding protein RhoN-like [Acanthaster planci]
MRRQRSLMALDEATRCKLVVVGDSLSGKTAMLHTFLGRQFTDVHTPTTFENYSSTMEINKYRMELTIWDTSGKPEYDSVRPLSYNEITIALICFDISRPFTLHNVVRKWHPEVRKHCPTSPIILVGCKMDLRNNIQVMAELSKDRGIPVSHDRGAKIGSQIGAAAYVECSARTNPSSVHELFEVASLAAMGKLKLHKSYIDLPSACRTGTLPGLSTTSLRRLSIRKKSESKVQAPVRVKAVVVERESRGCIVM